MSRPVDLDPTALERVEALVAQARAARGRGDGEACVAALEAAAAATSEATGTWRDTVAWRLAKAHHDYGDPARMLAALAPLLDDGEVFVHYPRGLTAVVGIARHAWDACGYRDRTPERLLEAARAAHLGQGEGYLAARCDVERAWALACRGDPELTALVRHYDRLTPRTFAAGQHQHPDAPDPGSSILWIQLELAHTALRACTWRRDASAARAVWDDALDTLEETGGSLARAPWLADAGARAAWVFGWDGPEPTTPSQQGARGAYEIAFHEALVSPPSVRAQAFAHAAATARRDRIGPEWQAEALLEAARFAAGTRRETWLAEARDVVERAGLSVFADATEARDVAVGR